MNNSKQNNPPKYHRNIIIQDEYKNFILDKISMKELATKHCLSYTRIRNILIYIGWQFRIYLDMTENNALSDLLYSSPVATKNYLRGQPEVLEKTLLAFDKFALHRIAEAEKFPNKL